MHPKKLAKKLEERAILKKTKAIQKAPNDVKMVTR